MNDLPTSPAELSLLLRQMAAMLDELHARREGTWLPDGPPNPFEDIETSYGSGAEAWANPTAQDFLHTMRGGLTPNPDGAPHVPDEPIPQKLTAGEWDELGRLAKEPQTTYGKGRARIQTRLVQYGFAYRFNTLEGERCAITDAGRERVTQGR